MSWVRYIGGWSGISSVPMSSNSEQRVQSGEAPRTSTVPEDEDAVTELGESRYLIITALLGHPQQSMSITEFEFMVPTLSESSIRYHVDRLCEEGVLVKDQLSSEYRRPKSPYTFYSFSDHGRELLSELGLSWREAWFEELHHVVRKTDRVIQIEEMPRP